MIGILGGSGLYTLEALHNLTVHEVDTPFGRPSGPIHQGTLFGAPVAFLPRHGPGHRLNPSELPYRANIYALKSLGVRWVLSVSAVGSLQEQLAPGHIALPSQYIDRTRHRPATFFADGVVGHVSLADPTCPVLGTLAEQAVRAVGLPCHTDCTYVCIEGPAFSTRAESQLYRQWGAHLVGMTALPEARLAREAELHYLTLALVTDYDCWRTKGEGVDIDAVLQVLRDNQSNLRRVLERLLPAIANKADDATCAVGCHSALRYAVVTHPEHISPDAKARLTAILSR